MNLTERLWLRGMHPRPQAQAREALTVALVQAVELLDCDWFFCPKGMLRVGTKCGLTLNNGWREECKYNKNRINTKLITVKQIFTCNCMDKFKTDGNQIH